MYCYWDPKVFYHGKNNEERSKKQLIEFHKDMDEVNKFDSSSEDYKKAYWRMVSKWITKEKVEDFREYINKEYKESEKIKQKQ